MARAVLEDSREMRCHGLGVREEEYNNTMIIIIMMIMIIIRTEKKYTINIPNGSKTTMRLETGPDPAFQTLVTRLWTSASCSG